MAVEATPAPVAISPPLTSQNNAKNASDDSESLTESVRVVLAVPEIEVQLQMKKSVGVVDDGDDRSMLLTGRETRTECDVNTADRAENARKVVRECV